jgi:hypothetical protein
LSNGTILGIDPGEHVAIAVFNEAGDLLDADAAAGAVGTRGAVSGATDSGVGQERRLDQ